MRYFNTEGCCKPKEHYMVRLDSRLDEIKRMYVDKGKYFVVNRGRQYGKTTTLFALADFLKDAYAVLPMDFQLMSAAGFADEWTFSAKFIGYVERLLSRRDDLKNCLDSDAVNNLIDLKRKDYVSMDLLFEGLSRICETSKKPVVMMIDEVDSASNHEVFIDFLAQLRGYYLNRENSPIFHSVILAGVYDVKNLKSKMRTDLECRYNSPWNIAADFDLDMSFSSAQIAAMLDEYEADYHTGMDTEVAAYEIYQYTSGYPYLVSAICKIIDENLSDHYPPAHNGKIWAREGIGEAVKILLNKRVSLFDSMMKHLNECPDLKKMLYAILFRGEQVIYNPDYSVIELADMLGYIKKSNHCVQAANRIFEMRLYNLFLSEEEMESIVGR